MAKKILNNTEKTDLPLKIFRGPMTDNSFHSLPLNQTPKDRLKGSMASKHQHSLPLQRNI